MAEVIRAKVSITVQTDVVRLIKNTAFAIEARGRMRTTKLFHTLASIEFFIIWCAFAVIGFVGGSLPGYIGGQSIMHFFEMKKYFENMPYETISAMAKGKYEANVMPPYNQEDIMFYACMVNSKFGRVYVLLEQRYFWVLP